MISEEHCENDEISFQIVYGPREPVKFRIRWTLHKNNWLCID